MSPRTDPSADNHSGSYTIQEGTSKSALAGSKVDSYFALTTSSPRALWWTAGEVAERHPIASASPTVSGGVVVALL